MINTIITSSILILIILVIRFIFKGRVNPMLQYGLWSLVVLRLTAFSWLSLYPIESSFSVMNIASNAAETLRGASSVDQVITGNSAAGTIDNAVLLMENVRTGVMTSGEGITAAAAIDWQLIIMIIWGLGTIALGIWLILVNRKFSKKIYENRKFLMYVSVDKTEIQTKISTAISTEIPREIPVYVVEGLDSPCLMGYKREVAIYVTSEVAADEQKLRYAVAHESCHFKHHDLVWSVVRGGLLAFYWFNPFVWAAAIMSKRDCELACDYGVIKELSEEDRLTYGKTLVDLISKREHKNNLLHMATSMYGGVNGIKERVIMIAKNNRMKAGTVVAVMLIVALSVGCTFTTSKSNANISSEEERPNYQIESKAAFEEAYKHGFPDFTEFAPAYQVQADEANDSWGRKEILENPETAATDQLNLVGAKVTGVYQDPYIKSAVVKFAWADGEITVNLTQPLITAEDGTEKQATVWVVVSESD